MRMSEGSARKVTLLIRLTSLAAIEPRKTESEMIRTIERGA